jgi:plasmid stabilization system protein ParE
MTVFRMTPQAETDLFDVWRYIASDNPEAADRVENAIYDACGILADGPLCGQTRRDLTVLPLRFWTVQRYPNYIIVYDPATTPLQIIRILHGMRDLKRVLDKP